MLRQYKYSINLNKNNNTLAANLDLDLMKFNIMLYFIANRLQIKNMNTFYKYLSTLSVTNFFDWRKLC